MTDVGDRIARAVAKRVRRAVRDALLADDPRGGPWVAAEAARVASAWDGAGVPDAAAVAMLVAPSLAKRGDEAEVARVLGELRAEAAARGVADPDRMPIPPRAVRAAWTAGDRDGGLAHVDRFVWDEVGRGLGRRTTAGVAAMVESGHPAALRTVDSVTSGLRGAAAVRARILFSHDGDTADRADELAGRVAALSAAEGAERSARDRAAHAARGEAARNAPLTWQEARAALDASEAEMRTWVAAGRLGGVGRRTDADGRRGVTFARATVEAAAASAPAWRREVAAPPRAVAGPDGASEDGRRRGERRRRAALAREAGLVLLPEGLRVDGPALRPGRVPFRPIGVVTSVPWPEAVRTLVRTGGPIAARTRVTAARRLRESVAAAAAAVQARLDAVVAEGEAVAGEVVPLSSPTVREVLAGHLAEALADAGTCDRMRPVDDAFRSEVLDAFVRAASEASASAVRGPLRDRTGLSDYPALFPLARAAGRRLVLHVGPTNSGKTHDAVRDLLASASGAYLAPLRLMALETFDRMNAAGVPTDMTTGEERVEVAGARHVSSTVETMRPDVAYDVAVIDEVQLLRDRDRGWAWTQAAFGVAAKVVHMTGSIDALPYVRRVAELTGEPLEVVRHERLTPLDAMAEPANEVRAGDAVVAFSRSEVMRLRQVLGASHRVATVYGALGPEVRRAEARRFRSGGADVLVATDAIAMGLNLPIRRVLFSSLHKFDGTARRSLTAAEVRQIAGRAGRHGMGERGEAGLLAPSLGGHAARPGQVAEALAGAADPPEDLRLPVMPPWRAVDAVAKELGTGDLARVLRHLSAAVLGPDPLLRPADLTDAIEVADLTEPSGLPLWERFRYLGCPVDLRDGEARATLREWSRIHARGAPVPAPACAVVGVPEAEEALERCEAASKELSAYLWLGRRWPGTYADTEGARAERARVDALIEGALARRVLLRHCRSCGRLMDPRRVGRECEVCAPDAGRSPRR